MSAVLSVQNLRKSFGALTAVDGISFSLSSGELLALIGPNGAGKSTCFNLINGQLKPDAGELWLEDRRMTGRKPVRLCRLGLGRTFQVAANFASMTVRENLQTALLARRRRLVRMWRAARRCYVEEADALLGRLGLEARGDEPCGQLAYADQKRVELAIALAGAPKVMLMDEPTAGMAPGERTQLMELVLELARSEKLAVLFTEHDMDVVFNYADRILVMDQGHLIAEGSPDEVRANREVQAVYLGEA